MFIDGYAGAVAGCELQGDGLSEGRKSKARDYRRAHLKRLYLLAGNQCAAPSCDNSLMARDGRTQISKICHIEAASPDGPRYNPDSTDDDRRHFDNLILLCDECHDMVDSKENEALYPVDLLRDWKSKHESKVLYAAITKQPSLLSIAIDAIAETELEGATAEYTAASSSFDIEGKLQHNRVVRNRALIDEYKVLYPRVNAIYETLEEQGSFKKDKLLRNIRLIYVRAVGAYSQPGDTLIETVRRHADDIIDDVHSSLLELVAEHPAVPEDVTFAVPVVMVDAFMRCKILEAPAR